MNFMGTLNLKRTSLEWINTKNLNNKHYLGIKFKSKIIFDVVK